MEESEEMRTGSQGRQERESKCKGSTKSIIQPLCANAESVCFLRTVSLSGHLSDSQDPGVSRQCTRWAPEGNWDAVQRYLVFLLYLFPSIQPLKAVASPR